MVKIVLSDIPRLALVAQITLHRLIFYGQIFKFLPYT